MATINADKLLEKMLALREEEQLIRYAQTVQTSLIYMVQGIKGSSPRMLDMACNMVGQEYLVKLVLTHYEAGDLPKICAVEIFHNIVGSIESMIGE